MAYIKTIPYTDSHGRLRTLYDRVKGPDDNVDNIMMAHSLRPHTMEGHMALYKNVLHHNANTLPKWFLETIGVWVSILNQCDYCVEHHYAGLCRLLGDNEKAKTIRHGMDVRDLSETSLSPDEQTALRYAETLTVSPTLVSSSNIEEVRQAGYSDGQILEINQVTAYFSYANRTVLGLGVTTQGDIIGLSPGNSDDPQDWHHQ